MIIYYLRVCALVYRAIKMSDVSLRLRDAVLKQVRRSAFSDINDIAENPTQYLSLSPYLLHTTLVTSSRHRVRKYLNNWTLCAVWVEKKL